MVVAGWQQMPNSEMQQRNNNYPKIEYIDVTETTIVVNFIVDPEITP